MSKKNEMTRRELLKKGAAGTGLLLGAGAITGGVALAGPTKKKGASALPQVPRRVLGKTGQKIPILLLGGAVQLNTSFDPKLAEALRFGVDYIDAADCYGGGSCERAVKSFHSKGKLRDKIWITSKSDLHEPKGFEATVEQSLERMGTSHVEMYYLHALKQKEYLSKDLAKVVARLKKAGKIKYFGFSCHNGNVAELLHAAAGHSWVDSVMFKYNFRSYGDKELNRAIDAAAKANVGLIAMKTQSAAASFEKRWQKFKQTGKWNKAQSVLKAVWADKRITAAVSHMDTLDKLKENIAAAVDRASLTLGEQNELRNYAGRTRSSVCEGCDHICGAQVDAPVQIGDTMRFLMYHDSYGETQKAQALFRALPKQAQRLDGVDFSGASRVCPHGLDVAEHMSRASRVLA